MIRSYKAQQRSRPRIVRQCSEASLSNAQSYSMNVEVDRSVSLSFKCVRRLFRLMYRTINTQFHYSKYTLKMKHGKRDLRR